MFHLFSCVEDNVLYDEKVYDKKAGTLLNQAFLIGA